MKEAIREVLATLRTGATMCPGELARRVGATQATLRPTLVAMADEGAVMITQRGEPADLRTLRGPYRVARA
jgi:DNA-binding IclR family transcriptional regulator